MAGYSEGRTGQLRVLLIVVVALGAITAAFAAVILVDGDEPAGGLVVALVAAVLLGVSITALRLLARRSSAAKPATAVAGVVSVLAGLGLAGSWLALLLPVLGMALLFLALIADEPAAPASGKGRR